MNRARKRQKKAWPLLNTRCIHVVTGLQTHLLHLYLVKSRENKILLSRTSIIVQFGLKKYGQKCQDFFYISFFT